MRRGSPQRGHTIHSMDDLMALYEKSLYCRYSQTDRLSASPRRTEVASLLLPRTFFYSGGIFPVPAATPAASSGTAVIAAKSFLRTLSFPCVSQGSAAGTADVPMQSFFLPSSLTHRSPSPSMFLLPGAVKTGGSLCSVLSGQPHLDENHISSLARSYRRHWRERLRAVSACAASLRELVRTCFTAFARQFMQIKTTRNKLFLLPT